MIDPATAFSLAGLLAIAGWAGLVIAAFVKGLRAYAWPAAFRRRANPESE